MSGQTDPRFSSVAWAVFENHGYGQVADLPSHKRLRDHPNGLWFTNYFATQHPSGPNYRVMAAGQKVSDEETVARTTPCLATALASGGIPFGSAIVFSCTATHVLHLAGTIAARHNPYADMLAAHTEAHISAAGVTAYLDALAGGPDHIYFGWDDLNDAHSGPLSLADSNLMALLDSIEQSKWFNTPDAAGHWPLFLFTWDESFVAAPVVEQQHVCCAALSKAFAGNRQDGSYRTHFSFCRTMYAAYDLPLPTADVQAAEALV